MIPLLAVTTTNQLEVFDNFVKSINYPVKTVSVLCNSYSFEYLLQIKEYCQSNFVEESAPYFGMNIVWLNEGLDTVGYDRNSKKIVIRVDPKYFRPAEVESLLGDASKAKEKLGWEPKISFKQLVEDMCIYGQ